MNKEKINSFWQTYQISLEVAQDKAPLIKRIFLFYILSSILQGLTFALFYPLLNSIFSENRNFDEIIFYFLLISGISLISFVFKWLASDFNYSENLVAITHKLRLNLGEKLKTIPLQELYKYRTGELNSILAQNVDEAVLHLGIVAGMFFEAIIIPLVVVLTTFFINPLLSFIFLLGFILAIPIYKWGRLKSKHEKKEVVNSHAKLEADTIEYIQGLAVLKAINQVGKNAKNLQNSIKEVRKIQKESGFQPFIAMVMINSLIEFVFIATLIIGSFLIFKEELNIASLIALLVILVKCTEPLGNFFVITNAFDLVHSGFEKIKEVLNIKTFEIEKPLQKPKNFDIEIKDLSFSYENNKEEILKDLNLNIKSGSLTAIVGESGSGKTTITKLIMRYADPIKGSITIGKANIKAMEQSVLMSYISVVFQDVYLFDDSILNNIRMGKPEASDEEVLEASKAAFCHEFVSRLAKGYDTKVGEIGGSLSGGERQRISIARAILKNSPIVILDEPTSSLDTQSEVAVQKAIDELIKNKTVIVIAHRLSTISHANKILVIGDKRLLEEGTHQELLAKKGKYFSMFEAQQRVKGAFGERN